MPEEKEGKKGQFHRGGKSLAKKKKRDKDENVKKK